MVALASTGVLLLLLLLQAQAGPTGNKKSQALEQEVAFLRDNLTAVWEMVWAMRSQIERLETDDRQHHHHHHYHHFYHNDSAYPDGEQNHTHEVFVSHERSPELVQHVHLNGHDPSHGDHHHYHHVIHHHHPRGEGPADVHIDDLQLQFENGNGHNGNGNGNGRQCHLVNGGKNEQKPKDICADDDGQEVLAEAVCHMKPNRALPANERQNVRGTVTFRQKASQLDIILVLRGFLTSPKHAHHGQAGQQGLHDLHVHGLHVHEFGDLSNGCESAGAHYNPLEEVHGGPDSPKRHIGDLGNVQCDDEGKLELKVVDSVASLTGPHSVIGKTLVIHENADDYGQFPEDEGSLANGNAGRRLACCVITKKD